MGAQAGIGRGVVGRFVKALAPDRLSEQRDQFIRAMNGGGKRGNCIERGQPAPAWASRAA